MSDSRRRWRCSHCANWFRTVLEIELPKADIDGLPMPAEHRVYCLPCLLEVGGFIIGYLPPARLAWIRLYSSNETELTRISDTSVTPGSVVETPGRGDGERQDPGSGYVLRWPHD